MSRAVERIVIVCSEKMKFVKVDGRTLIDRGASRQNTGKLMRKLTIKYITRPTRPKTKPAAHALMTPKARPRLTNQALTKPKPKLTPTNFNSLGAKDGLEASKCAKAWFL